MQKSAYFITQANGGSGKSLLTFMLAEKYREAVILDLDDATTTSMKQLAYRKPVLVSFLDPNSKRIDRDAFNGLFDSVRDADPELFIADLGASVAEQLPKYFSMTGIELVTEQLAAYEIQLQLVCVVGGGNIFRASMEYLVELVDSTKGHLEITVAANGFYPCLPEQKVALNEYIQINNLTHIHFNLVKDMGEIAKKTIENVLQNGKGTSGLSGFTSIYFRSIAELKL